MSTAQHYIGTKQIQAWPEDKDGQPGYGVRYPDGYVSWSPKDVFEAAYLPMGQVEHLEPHQQRVVGEKVELDDKVTKLRAFLDGNGKDVLSQYEYRLMHEQANLMVAYSDLLGNRIAAFGQEA